MPPAIGYWDVTSPNVRTTSIWPATTIGIVQMKAGPAVANPKAKSVYTPTTGERYVNPSEKLLHSPSARVSCCLYPNEASCAASARICSASIRPPSGSPGTLGDTATLQRPQNEHKVGASSDAWRGSLLRCRGVGARTCGLGRRGRRLGTDPRPHADDPLPNA